MKEECPNFSGWQIVNIKDFVADEEKKQAYIDTYCHGENAGYTHCKRFQTKKALNFCPNFVMPDSPWSIDEIMEKCENEE
jgi:hypothetical protein